jgi:hypothetical protein
VSIDENVAERFVRENWTALAASAWRFHLSHGPGALVVDWAVVERWHKHQDVQFQPRYATETDSPAFNAEIKRYDPQTAIVIAFSQGNGAKLALEEPAAEAPVTLTSGTALAAMTVTALPPPPVAHRARGH